MFQLTAAAVGMILFLSSKYFQPWLLYLSN